MNWMQGKEGEDALVKYYKVNSDKARHGLIYIQKSDTTCSRVRVSWLIVKHLWEGYAGLQILVMISSNRFVSIEVKGSSELFLTRVSHWTAAE